MVKKPNQRKVNRRNFLKVAGAGVFGVSTIVGRAKGMVNLPGGPPYYVSGHRTLQFEPNGDTYILHEQFVSDELNDPYGDSVVEFDIDHIPREVISDEYKNPDVSFTLEKDDSAMISTCSEFADDERRYIGPEPKDVIGGGGSSGPPSYLGPQYSYKSGDKLERTGPINVGWLRYDGSAGDVKHTMKHEFGGFLGSANWDSPLAGTSIKTRYVLVNNELKETDREVAKVPTGGFSSQWHIRLYNISEDQSNGYGVVGQAHYDTWDHGLFFDPEFQFSNSRRRVLSAWRDHSSYSTTNQDIYNTYNYPQSDSSEGKLGIMYME